MAYVTWSRGTGSWNTRVWTSVRGVKQVPFDPSHKPPLGYRVERRMLKDHQLGRYQNQVGVTLWGELTPPHIVTSGFEPLRTQGLDFTSEGSLAYANAYAKFKEKAYTQAANLTALRERAKTIDMISQRLTQLFRGARALRRGRFREFLATFGIRPLKKHERTRWTRPKQFGALWLEYWMGWAPTIGDIYNSVDAYCREIPNETIRAGSSVPLHGSSTRQSGGAKAISSYEGKGTVWIQGQVEITNPDLHKAQALGLINPALTVWETTPFSWFFGWFSTLSQTLGQLTDWVGLRLQNTTVSAKTEAVSSWHCSDARHVFGWEEPPVMYHSKSFFWFSRHVVSSLPLVKPQLRLPNGLSLSRGATLASLLTTMFAPTRNNQLNGVKHGSNCKHRRQGE